MTLTPDEAGPTEGLGGWWHSEGRFGCSGRGFSEGAAAFV